MHPTRGVASNVAAHASMPRLSLFFILFFFTDSLQLSSIRTDSASIHAELGRFGQNQAISTKLGRIDRRPKWPKQVEIDIESCQNSRNQL